MRRSIKQIKKSNSKKAKIGMQKVHYKSMQNDDTDTDTDFEPISRLSSV